MITDGYTHWVILQVAANTLVSVAPVYSLASVYVTATIQETMAVLARGDVAAMPLIGNNLQALRSALQRHGVVV